MPVEPVGLELGYRIEQRPARASWRKHEWVIRQQARGRHWEHVNPVYGVYPTYQQAAAVAAALAAELETVWAHHKTRRP